jgi:hypothetical protein
LGNDRIADNNYVHLQLNQFFRKAWQTIWMALGCPKLELDAPALHISEIVQLLPKRANDWVCRASGKRKNAHSTDSLGLVRKAVDNPNPESEGDGE